MDVTFDKNRYYGYIIKGDLIGAINYVKAYPDQSELFARYAAIFEREQYPTYQVDAVLNNILKVYQVYYRNVFYLRIGKEKAEENLQNELANSLGLTDSYSTLAELEEKQIAAAFQNRGFFFLGGKTGGYYGPYIWKSCESKTYEVELPGGMQSYTVNLLDGFLFRSWLDYLSFGAIGTGGWTDGDGIINCVKTSYDFESEAFQVSLLKHEAQHARDLAENPEMSSENLEYRAKLVELMYSRERNLLKAFAHEADGADQNNGHGRASNRIILEFAKRSGINPEKVIHLPVSRIQEIAKELFEQS